MKKTASKNESAVDAVQDIMDVAKGLMQNLNGSSPIGNEDDLEEACIEGFFDLVNSAEHVRVAMRREGYKVPTKPL